MLSASFGVRLRTAPAGVRRITSAALSTARMIGGPSSAARLPPYSVPSTVLAGAPVSWRATSVRGMSKKKDHSKGDKEEDSGPPMAPFRLEDYKTKMEAGLEVLKKELASLQTGRAFPGLLDSVTVAVGHNRTPLNKLGQITVRDPQNLVVSLYDVALVPNAVKAIAAAGLSLNGLVEGALIRVPVPKPSKEARESLSKVVSKHQEHVKQNILRVRKEGMDYIKVLEKKKAASENDLKRQEKDLQKVVDDINKKIHDICAAKVKEIMSS